jgi:hypothetical protein
MKKKKRKSENKSRGPRLSVATVPIARTYTIRRSVPRRRNIGNNYRVSGEDFYSDMVLDANGDLDIRFDINPGLDTYPWLQPQANGYDKWKVISWVVSYVPKNAVLTTTGAIYGAYDYDAMDRTPATAARIMTYKGVRQTALYSKQSFPLDTKSISGVGPTWKIVRNGPTSRELNLFDPASFHFLVRAGAANANLADFGQLHFSYTVEFACPGLERTHSIPRFMGDAGGATVVPVADTGWIPIHWANLAPDSSVMTVPTPDVIHLQPGVYRISYGTCIRYTGQVLTAGEYRYDTSLDVIVKGTTQVCPGSYIYQRRDEQFIATETYDFYDSYSRTFMCAVTVPTSLQLRCNVVGNEILPVVALTHSQALDTKLHCFIAELLT